MTLPAFAAEAGACSRYRYIRGVQQQTSRTRAAAVDQRDSQTDAMHCRHGTTEATANAGPLNTRSRTGISHHRRGEMSQTVVSPSLIVVVKKLSTSEAGVKY